MKYQRIFSLALVAGLLSPYVVLATEPPITAMAFAPDGKSVAAASQVGVQVFSWPDLRHQQTIEASAANLYCVAFSPKGDRLAVGGGNPSAEGVVEIFSWPAGESIATISVHEDSVTDISWRDASHLFSASLDGQIKLCDVEKQNALRSYTGHSRGVSSFCLLKDEKTLVSVGDDQSVRVWNSLTGELIRSLSQHTKPIHAVALLPAEGGLAMVASAAGDRTIRFWQPTIGRMIRYVRLEAEPLDIAWTNDGSRILAACVDGNIRVINPLEVRVTQKLAAIDGWAYAIAVHPTDSSVVVGGTDGQIRRVELGPDTGVESTVR